jgi:uncharacterized membrane protein
MPSALRRLGVFLFCFGGLAVVVALVPVTVAWVSNTTEQTWVAIAMVGGLLVISGLVMDWLGSQAIRDQEPREPKLSGEHAFPVIPPTPPAMRLSSKPKGAKGYREDLMA